MTRSKHPAEVGNTGAEGHRMVTTPGVIIAGTTAAGGQTELVDRLVRDLSTMHSVARFSIGSDIPGCRLLDPVMCSPELMTGLFLQGSRDTDLAVVVGVAGLFDARATSGGSEEGTAPGSPAHVATLLGLPVVLLIDVSGMSQSVGAVVRGFTMMDTSVRIGGVILAGTTSHTHEQICRLAVEAQGIPVLDDARGIAAVAAHPTPGGGWGRGGSVVKHRGDPVVAVSDGADPELGELLEQAGATVLYFNAMTDTIPNCDGLMVLGGLAPDLDLRAYADAGKPLHAAGQAAWRLAELLELDISRGEYDPGVYREAVALEDSLMFSTGERVIGTDYAAAVLPGANAAGWNPMWGWRSSEGHIVREGFHRGVVSATCLRVHPAVVPGGIERFVTACVTA